MSKPPLTGWTCASWNPGTSMRPARSTTSVPGPTACRTSSSVPTIAIRPSVIATACAQLRAASTVYTAPFTSTVSADAVGLMDQAS